MTYYNITQAALDARVKRANRKKDFHDVCYNGKLEYSTEGGFMVTSIEVDECVYEHAAANPKQLVRLVDSDGNGRCAGAVFQLLRFPGGRYSMMLAL